MILLYCIISIRFICWIAWPISIFRSGRPPKPRVFRFTLIHLPRCFTLSTPCWCYGIKLRRLRSPRPPGFYGPRHFDICAGPVYVAATNQQGHHGRDVRGTGNVRELQGYGNYQVSQRRALNGLVSVDTVCNYADNVQRLNQRSGQRGRITGFFRRMFVHRGLSVFCVLHHFSGISVLARLSD